jgi:ABC-type multidrug transport system fused ATPase/permease subunit
VYIRFLTNPVRSVARIPVQMHAHRVAAERVMEILNLQSLMTETHPGNRLQAINGNISFQQVSFSVRVTPVNPPLPDY